MAIVHLMIDDDYVESFVASLDNTKIRIIEKDFQENKILLENSLRDYQLSGEDFKPLTDTMKDIDIWLEGKDENNNL